MFPKFKDRPDKTDNALNLKKKSICFIMEAL